MIFAATSKEEFTKKISVSLCEKVSTMIALSPDEFISIHKKVDFKIFSGDEIIEIFGSQEKYREEFKWYYENVTLRVASQNVENIIFNIIILNKIIDDGFSLYENFDPSDVDDIAVDVVKFAREQECCEC